MDLNTDSAIHELAIDRGSTFLSCSFLIVGDNKYLLWRVVGRFTNNEHKTSRTSFVFQIEEKTARV